VVHDGCEQRNKQYRRKCVMSFFLENHQMRGISSSIPAFLLAVSTFSRPFLEVVIFCIPIDISKTSRCSPKALKLGLIPFSPRSQVFLVTSNGTLLAFKNYSLHRNVKNIHAAFRPVTVCPEDKLSVGSLHSSEP
jgi:hypothetical protein